MKINYPKVAEHLGVKLRGNETFDELLKIEQQVKEYNENHFLARTSKIYVDTQNTRYFT